MHYFFVTFVVVVVGGGGGGGGGVGVCGGGDYVFILPHPPTYIIPTQPPYNVAELTHR